MLRENLEKMLEKVKEEERRVISISIKKDDMESLDIIAKNFSYISNKNITRQMLIDEAIQSFNTEAIKLLETKYNINDLYAVESEEDNVGFDTVILPAQQDGFIETFLGEQCWYYVRINEKNIPHLKYIGVYVGKPESAITHYAEIDRFDYNEEYGKYIVHFKGNPYKLEKRVPLGKAKPTSVRSPKYTTLAKLKKATDFTEL